MPAFVPTVIPIAVGEAWIAPNLKTLSKNALTEHTVPLCRIDLCLTEPHPANALHIGCRDHLIVRAAVQRDPAMRATVDAMSRAVIRSLEALADAE